MAKAIALSALCILAFATIAHAHQKDVYNVEGDVYCDTCRVQFPTNISYSLMGAKVKLECTNTETGLVTYSVEGETDAAGRYQLEVKHDHQNDVCEVVVVESPDSQCSEIMPMANKSRIEITEDSGMHNDVRYANPIGFMPEKALPGCNKFIKELFDDITKNVDKFD